MIPKKADDGSFTKLISEMRPISVLPEFGKIASKILANRLGAILLEHPSIMSSSQRAFLKDGSTSQCLHTALNILEDFKEDHKRNSKKQLFMLAYDQSRLLIASKLTPSNNSAPWSVGNTTKVRVLSCFKIVTLCSRPEMRLIEKNAK